MAGRVWGQWLVFLRVALAAAYGAGMFTIPSRLLRAAVGVIAASALTAAPVAFSGAAQAAKAPQVTLKTSVHTVLTTGKFTVHATTAHPVRATKVVLQRQAGRTWRNAGTFPHHRGGRLHWSRPPVGDLRLRAEVLLQGQVLDISPVVVVHVKAPAKHTVQPTSHSCTRTSTGSCIRGGEFCKQSMYGQTGYDGSGRAWRCTGDHTHPHWE
jgi:hypothetical protein